MCLHILQHLESLKAAAAPSSGPLTVASHSRGELSGPHRTTNDEDQDEDDDEDEGDEDVPPSAFPASASIVFLFFFYFLF